MIFFSTQNVGNHKKHLAFIACVVFAKFMMTFAKVKKDLKNKMKKKHLLASTREKKADLSQSRISDTCIIIGSTFLRLLLEKSLSAICTPILPEAKATKL